MVLVDNREGFGANVNNGADEYNQELLHLLIKDIMVYGEHENPDCPQNGGGGYCHRFNKYGFLTGAGTRGGKDYHIGTMSPLPPNKIKSIATMHTQMEMHNLTFKGFTQKTE